MIGQTLGHYKVLEQIGEGGMGVVYRAHDSRLGRDVALKVLPTTLAGNPDARERLLHEARTASRLNHPYICVVHDVGEAEGQIYVAMELIRGQTLRTVAAGGPLAPELVLRYGIQMADALAHAHRHGVIHRDLKTANVIVTEGRVKILDFGLAIQRAQPETGDATRSRLSLESSSAVAGTLAYVAPELLRGQPSDERSDVWSLGVILYELASGKRPFTGDTDFELSSAILVKAPEVLPGRMSPTVEMVIHRSLKKDPRQRYQSAGEVQAALETTYSDSSVLIRTRPRRRSGRIRALAVLPLQNLTRDSEQEYFTDGMTEELITELAKISSLKVISRTSAMQYKGASKPVAVIAEELGVDAVVEGTVLRAGDRVRISAQLIHAATEKHLWAESYEREMTEILELQHSVAQAIAAQIRGKLTPKEKARMGSARKVNAEVYELYLRGRFHWNKLAVEEIRKAIEYFAQAIQLDPKYAPGYAALADCYSAMQFFGQPAEEIAPQAREAARKAVECDASLAGAHSSLATVHFFFDWDWAEAEKAYRQALELDPNSPAVLQEYAYLLTAMGRLEEAIDGVKRAREMDPLALAINVNLGWRYYYARRYERAIRQLQKTLELDSRFGNAYWCLGCAQVQTGAHAEAVANLEKAVALYAGHPHVKASLGQACGIAGRTEDADRILRELEEMSARMYVSPWARAIVLAGLGRKEICLDWLEKAFEQRMPALVWLKVHPEVDMLRAEPRFQALLSRMRFPH